MTTYHDLLLLDLDGTISDPLVGIGRSINYALAHFGHNELELLEIAPYIGPPLDLTFKSITGIENPAKIAEFVRKYRERYGDIGYSENVLYPGIDDVLLNINKSEIPLAVCTSKRVDFAEQILEMFNLRTCFRFVSGGEVGIHKWQQIESLKEKALVTNSTVMIGDRAVDLVAAHKNGLSTAGVLWGYGGRTELESEYPKYLFSHPAELLHFAKR